MSLLYVCTLIVEHAIPSNAFKSNYVLVENSIQAQDDLNHFFSSFVYSLFAPEEEPVVLRSSKLNGLRELVFNGFRVKSFLLVAEPYRSLRLRLVPLFFIVLNLLIS